MIFSISTYLEYLVMFLVLAFVLKNFKYSELRKTMIAFAILSILSNFVLVGSVAIFVLISGVFVISKQKKYLKNREKILSYF